MVRVLHIIDSLDAQTGGPPVAVLGLARACLESGRSCLVLASSTSKDPSRVTVETAGLNTLTVRVVKSWRWGRQRATSLRLLARAFVEGRTHDVIIIHGFYLWSSIIGWAVARFWKKPLLLIPHGVFERYQQRRSLRAKSSYDWFIGRRIRAAVSAVLIASESEAVGAGDFFSSESIYVIGLGVDESPLRPLGPIHSPLRILSLCRIAEKKRLEVVIEVIDLLRTVGFIAELTVAGTGGHELMERLKNQVRELDLEKQVRFVGHLDYERKVEALRATDLLFQVSDNENFAFAVAEALAIGVPVITSQGVAASQFVVSSGAGRVVESPNPLLIVEALMDLINDEGGYEQACKAGVEVARDHLSWKSVNMRLSELIERITA